jgi:diguanylate cyclase (GGDEF)-like protein/PAS domain S-box-containing protein
LKILRFFVSLSLLIGLEASILLFNYWRDIENHLLMYAHMQQTALSSALDSYQRMLELIHGERFDLSSTKALLIQAAHTDAEELEQIRSELLNRYQNTFSRLTGKGVRTLQFVLPNGHSLLRFSKPDLPEQDLLATRPMLRQVLAGYPQSSQFENDPLCPCYFFAFPITSGGRIIGAVDFGVPFEAIRNAMHQSLGSNAHFELLLNRVAFAESRPLHGQTSATPDNFGIHPDYLIINGEDSNLTDTTLTQVKHQLRTNPQIQSAITRGTDLSREICLSGKTCYAVNLNVVPDSQMRKRGYILSISPLTATRQLRRTYWTTFLLGSSLIILALYTFHHWLQTNQRLRTVSDHMAEGMYVLDTSGKILYINPAACQTLDYSKQQLNGQAAHKLFHCHADGKPLSLSEYTLLQHTMRGEQYQSDDEHFRCRDGRVIRVSVLSSPLWTASGLSGSVVLFRDITQEYEVQKRQQRSEVALSTLAEGVMVTRPDGCIETVNPAFCEITGYNETEVLGKKPNILKSGRHDKTFYSSMWKQLIIEGHWEGEVWNRRKNGQIYPEFLRIASVTDEQGNVTDYVATFTDTTEKRHQEQQLHKLAYTDPLTQLHNRVAFLEMFEHTLAHAERQNSRCALLYLDLDRFKKINDTLGHQFGDQLLVEIANRLDQAVRTDDVVARLGGDEFIVLLEDIRQDNAPARVARKIVSLLGQPISLDPHVLHVTTSIGIAVYPEDGRDANTLLKNADSAMYMAKREGRNGYHYFTEAMAKREHNRFKLEIDLHSALLNEEFLLRYQPKIDLSNDRIIGVEALLYWQHPQRGLLNAGEFLSVAHDAGVMRDITNWVINASCDQMLSWLDQGLDPGRLAINIDTLTFNSSDAYDQIFRTVELTGVNPNHVDLEISENGILERPFDDPLWRQLVDLGFTLSIDDFGTGVSSLYRLKHLPVTTLKIDLSFIRDIETDEDDRSIIRTVIRMGQSLGLRVLAEGVENARQRDFVKNIGCNEAQGYFYSKPIDAAQITAILKPAGQQNPAVLPD